LWPMELYLDRLCHRATTRICSLPMTNPVAKIAKSITRRVKKQPSPLHILMDKYDASWENTETITPAIRRPSKDNKFKVVIPVSRKESKEMEEKDDADIKIASDGSGYEGGIGAAAVLWRSGKEGMAKLKLHLGDENTQTVFAAEGAGALLGWHLLSKEREMQGKKISFYIDSQALVKALTTGKTKSGQWVVEFFVRKINQWITTHKPERLTIIWITAHSGVE
ncbi:hypothetical protein DL96DRAFT_1412149, partial [Flagelloscypha sp. PMI_526]